MRDFMTAEFVRFLLTGGFAAAVNFLSRILYDTFVSFSVAIVLAYLTGMVTAYVLARLLVFKKSDRSVRDEMLWFSLINVAAVLQTWLVSMALYLYVLPQMMGNVLEVWHKEIAHFVGIVVPVFTSFLGHKYLTFRRTDPDGA